MRDAGHRKLLLPSSEQWRPRILLFSDALFCIIYCVQYAIILIVLLLAEIALIIFAAVYTDKVRTA